MENQEFNFTPVKHGDRVTIHKGGVQIDVDVSYNAIIDLVTQLDDEEKWNLIQVMRVGPNSC
jgi:hypothetical protein